MLSVTLNFFFKHVIVKFARGIHCPLFIFSYIWLMDEYIYRDEYRGKTRELLILFSAGSQDYRVFSEGQLLGIMTASTPLDETKIWKTDYNALKPIASKIGAYIISCEAIEK